MPTDKNLTGLKNYWVCKIKGRKWVAYDTISYAKKYSIAKFIEGSTRTWAKCQQDGWECVKVNVSLELVNKN